MDNLHIFTAESNQKSYFVSAEFFSQLLGDCVPIILRRQGNWTKNQNVNKGVHARRRPSSC